MRYFLQDLGADVLDIVYAIDEAFDVQFQKHEVLGTAALMALMVLAIWVCCFFALL